MTSPKDAAWEAWFAAVRDGGTYLGLEEWLAAEAKKAPALPVKMDGQSNGPQVMDAVREVARRTVAEHGDDSCLRFFVTYSFAIEFGAEDVENWSRDMLQGVMAEHCITMLDQGHEPDSWELHEAGKV